MMSQRRLARGKWCAGLTSALAVAMAVAFIVRGTGAAAAIVPDGRAAVAMQQYFSGRTMARQYSASRRLEASGHGLQAWMHARTDFSEGSGLLYEVTAQGGSGFIRARVLQSILDEEQRVIARGAAATIAITADNYDFTPQGINDDGLAVIAMRPLRKDRALIKGRMFLTTDGDLRRVEGQLAASPSFWVRRVDLVRSYRRINGVLMPVSLESTAQLRLLGASEMRMTYEYSRIDEQPVSD
jgi:hypothetical protein